MSMPIWDPYFGWDFDRIRGTVFTCAFLALLAIFISTTEGHRWYYPFQKVADFASAHEDGLLLVTILSLIAGFYYWKYATGEF